MGRRLANKDGFEDYDVKACIDAIHRGGRSGQIGDGKVWVTPVESLVRIRTGEMGSDAL